MNTRFGRAALAALLAFGAARANAQITTVVAQPPKRNAATRQEVVQREQAAQDSIARVTLTGMTQWVDSAAAALAIRPDTGAPPASDTSAAPRRADTSLANVPVAATKPAAAQPRADTAEFREGARAPATATPIPTLAVAGGLMVMLGFILRRRPRPSKVRVRR